MIDIILILKGLLIGIAKVIPGISGSLLAVSIGLYDRGIEAISHFFKDFKSNLVFLGNIGIGVLIAIVVGSGIIGFFLERYPFSTILLFLGFIMGTFPSLFKDTKISSKKDILIIVFVSTFLLLFTNIQGKNIFVYTGSFRDNIIVFLLGMIDAATMVIPGISGTAIFMILGCYTFVLDLFASPMNGTLFTEYFPSFLFFGSGVIIGAIVVSMVMSYMLKNHRKKTYLCIFGFAISSILLLFFDVFKRNVSINQMSIGFLFCIIGYILSFHLNKSK